MNIAENFKFTKIEILYNRVTSMLSPFDTNSDGQNVNSYVIHV